MLSKYTRPCFLTWDYYTSLCVFGHAVVNGLARVTASAGLEFGGVVARPLYHCMGVRPDGACMAMASMSRVFQGGPARGEYLRSRCAKQSGGAPVSDSAPLRALLLYAVTAVEDGEGHAVRMRPVRAAVSAPPDRWGWGSPEGSSGRLKTRSRSGRSCR